MDLLVEKGNLTFQLSNMGVTVTDIQATNAQLESTRESISYRNGKIFYGAVCTEKTISVTGYYYAKDEFDDQLIQDNLNGLFVTNEPFYISRMYSTIPLYSYERPGQDKGFELQKSESQLPYKYHWKVLLSDAVGYSFQGRSNKGLLYQVTFSFITADIPYGMTQPEDIELKSGQYISYSGTADCSQLEYPFVLELTSTQAQGSSFSFAIDEQVFTYTSANAIKEGDVFELKGTSFLLNGLNINDKTNIQFFTLKSNNDNRMLLSTEFKGEILLKNKVEFYL